MSVRILFVVAAALLLLIVVSFFIGLYRWASHSKRPLVAFSIVAALLLFFATGVAGLVWTSGALSKDWASASVFVDGDDVVLDIDGAQVSFENSQWPPPLLEFPLQVSGWTTSAREVTPSVSNGEPGYVYAHYEGRGVSTVFLCDKKITIGSKGREVLINGTWRPLIAGERLMLEKPAGK